MHLGYIVKLLYATEAYRNHMGSHQSYAEMEQNDTPTRAFIEAAQRKSRSEELEQAIASNIDNEPDEHQWVDLSFELRGSSDLRYQILQRHHNLMWLDTEMGAIVDDITQEWELEPQDAALGASGFEYRTLTYHSDDAGEHRALAETILRRVYGIDVGDVEGIELSP
jgi:hypothetical protein